MKKGSEKLFLRENEIIRGVLIFGSYKAFQSERT